MSRQQTTLLFEVPTPGASRQSARSFAKLMESELAPGRAFCCLITSDKELRRLNRQFRNQDYPTDVLSFPFADSDEFLGEIAISFARAKQQADEHGHTVTQEIEILMLHGLLHLLGMDHETDGGQMKRREQNWRRKLGLPNALVARTASQIERRAKQ
jgi:probable rRNA maturation factor